MPKITEETLENLRKTQQKSNFASQAHSMFVDGLFNYGNWNGGDGIIRQLFSSYGEDSIRHETKVFELDFTYNSLHFWGDVIVTHTWHEDQNHATIVFSGSVEINGVYQAEKFEEVAYFTWYKNRGKTESAKYNGKQMTETEYLFILNAIQEAGFKFDLSN